MRHGQATHNVAKDNHTGPGNPYLDPALTDAPLSPLGKEQAAALREATAALPIEVVLVSPLVRAVETACLAFSTQLERGVPFVAVELCREQIGQNMCDSRRPKSIAAAAFPKVDFGAIEEEDVLFSPERETLVAMCQRAGRLLEALRQRPEQAIAVVTHSSFLAALFNGALDCRASPQLGEWFETGEMRGLQLQWPTAPQAEPPPPPPSGE